MKDDCKHVKVFQNMILASNPPKQRWICALCGEKDMNGGGINSLMGNEEASYEDIEKLFKDKEKRFLALKAKHE